MKKYAEKLKPFRQKKKSYIKKACCGNQQAACFFIR